MEEKNESKDVKRKKAMRIMEGLSASDGEFVEKSMEEAAKKMQKKKIYRRYLAAAAVLAVAALGGLGIRKVAYKGGNATADNAPAMEEALQLAEAEGNGNAKSDVTAGAANGAAEGEEAQQAQNGDAGARLAEEDKAGNENAFNSSNSNNGQAAEAPKEVGEAEAAEEEAYDGPPLSEIFHETENWGLGFGESGTQPTGNATPAQLKPYHAYYLGSPDEKVIYLTFDCGYESGYTPAILDTLKKHNVKATFFIVGHYIESAPDLVKRMTEEGHTIGNHSYSHPDMSKILDEESFLAEMKGVSDLYEELMGKEMSMYYRPPQGKFNAKNLEMANELGYYTIFWSLAHVDWDVDNQPDPATSIERLNSRIHPGAVVLLHIVSKTNSEILDELLTDWENMGYRFGSLDELCK